MLIKPKLLVWFYYMEKLKQKDLIFHNSVLHNAQVLLNYYFLVYTISFKNRS